MDKYLNTKVWFDICYNGYVVRRDIRHYEDVVRILNGNPVVFNVDNRELTVNFNSCSTKEIKVV